ncbi:hypothetical protein DFH06DRAFT_1371504 [Mycena polygramma]|nr:hypothetical protein DFH06DRAFT_1371504 [Mycena polygramma]
MPARRKSRPAVDVWTPQLHLYEDDAKLFNREPFATVFTEYRAKTGGRTYRQGKIGSYLWECLEETMKDPRYLQHTSDWLCFTLGAKIVEQMPEEAIVRSGKLLLEVWYIRYLHDGAVAGEDLAYDLLFDAQTENFKTYYESYGEVSTDFCWNDDLDRRETWQEDLDGERDSDWEDWDDDDSKDGDYQDEEEDDEDSMDVDDPVYEDLDGHDDLDDLDDLDHPELPQFVEDATHGSLRPLPDKPSKLFNPEVDGAPLELWAAHIEAFFFPNDADGPREVHDMREDLVQIRRLPPNVYQTESFQQALQKSVFLGYLYDICEPGTMLETSHPDVEESYRWHNWSVSYAELICRWIKPTLDEEEYLQSSWLSNGRQSLPKCDENYRFSQDLAMDLLKFMSDHPRMLPWGFDPMAVFMFISLDSFTVNCEKWLVPCLRTLKYPWIDGWNAATVYREIMNLPVFKNPDKHADVLEQLDHRLAVVIEETSKHRTVLAKVKDELLRPAHRPDAGEVTDMEDTSEEEDEDEDEADEDSSDDEMDVDAVDGVQLEPVASTSSRPPPPPRKLLTELSKEGKKRRQREEKKRRAKDGRLPRHSGSAGLRAKEEVLAQPAKKKRAEEGPCPYCALLPRKQHCVRIVPVRRRKCKHLIGAALTCASLKNRLKPLPPLTSVQARRKGHAPKPRPRIRFYHPFKQLNMKLIKFRPEVYKRCKKDIVRFVWRAPDGKEEMVGGVRFKPFSKPILGRLNDNHRLVQVRAIRRRDMMQRWAYGSITGRGSRQPSGGRKGDCYGPYACHRGDTPDDIRALFRDAVSTDAMVEVGDTIAPGMRKNINELTRKSGVDRLGRTGLTNYVCSNYINCLHPDNDGSLEDFLAGRGKKDSKGGLYPCAQLLKKGCGKHAFNFAYARFGVVIRTMTNTVWVFNGRHVHGTVMPSQSRMMRLRGGAGKGDGSKGSHPNAKAANVARARKIREIRGGYNLRPRPA